MNKLREKSDFSFFFVCLKIGIGVLIYRGSLDLLSVIIVPAIVVVGMIAPENVALSNSISYFLTGMVSVVAFLFAAIFLWISLRIGRKRPYRPAYWGVHIPFVAPFLIVATIALNFAMSEINAMLIALLSPGVEISLGIIGTGRISVVEIILLIISTAVIPGIVEEIMFRGIILTNLAPYGKGMAIVASALLFGLMHMNPSQFFYTTLMGITLGYIYVKTRSIWICMVIHFTNNALGVLQQIFYQCYDIKKADELSAIMMITVAVLGMVSVGVLLIARAIDRKKAPEKIGSFGRIYAPALSYEERQVTKWGKIPLFFSSSVSVFTVVVFASMISSMLSILWIGLLLGFFPGVFTV